VNAMPSFLGNAFHCSFATILDPLRSLLKVGRIPFV
jgi:hypothetical protein